MIQQLEICADLENIASLKVQKDHDYFLKIVCKSCHEEFPNAVSINPQEQVEVPGSRGIANLVIRCKNCQREHSMSVVEKSQQSYTEEHAGSFRPMLQVESRGVEIVNWELRDGFYVEISGSGKVFEDVDLHEDWYEYDDVSQASVSVSNIKTQIKTKK
eukprot:TRINITY_DN4517_c0_g1_i1.p1 TRINITY_DN4517_c0_g1~~TRINITY_DN4517_c0_g1_i1.p1  ORF type:complete len:159 (+),score=35.67 TRINITY_DN4517_c0_g1_i1:110-586(+)